MLCSKLKDTIAWNDIDSVGELDLISFCDILLNMHEKNRAGNLDWDLIEIFFTQWNKIS